MAICNFRFAVAAFLVGSVAVSTAHAGLPCTYRLALIQVAYNGKSAAYSRLQLLTAAEEIKSFYSDASYNKLKLEIAISSFDTRASQETFFVVNSKGESSPASDHASVVGAIAGGALVTDHIDFSKIDGISVLSSFCAAPDYTVGSVAVSAPFPVAGRYDVSYLFENCGSDPRLLPPGPSSIFWGSWAHEMGHMISGHAGNWAGHPSGYASGYALMDSAYPSSLSAYSVIGTAFMTGDKRMFNGWLPDHQVVTVPPSSGFTSQTFPLRALTASPYTALCGLLCSQQQVIKVPLTDGLYYLVEARKRVGVDTLPTTLFRGGLWDEGVHITRVDQSADPPVKVINSCDSLVPGGCDKGTGDPSVGRPDDPRHKNCLGPQGYSVDLYPKYCWPTPLFHVGDTFLGDAGIQISVVGTTADGFSVNVQRGAWSGIPDLGVAPRPPVPTIPGLELSGVSKNHLWIDSFCNGYASDVGAAGLRFGDPAQSQTLAVGDDLCLGHENRIYARIENRGSAPAQGVRVHFDVGDPAAPLGACWMDQCRLRGKSGLQMPSASPRLRCWRRARRRLFTCPTHRPRVPTRDLSPPLRSACASMPLRARFLPRITLRSPSSAGLRRY